MALIAFPMPITGESVAGYFFRLAKSNGLANLERLYKMTFGKEVYRYNRISVEELCMLTQHRPEAFDHLWLTYADTYYLFRGVVIPLNQICEEDNRWCPECWKQNSIIPCVWQIGWMPVCDVHETLLLDACPACGGEIRYKRHLPACNACKMMLAEMDAAVAPPAVLASQRRTFAKIWAPTRTPTDYSRNPVVKLIGEMLNAEEVHRRRSKVDRRAAPRWHYWLSVAQTVQMYQKRLADREVA